MLRQHPCCHFMFLLLTIALLGFQSSALGAVGSRPEADALVEKGIRSCRKGDFEEGIRYFNRVLKMEPGHYLALLNRGIAWKDQNAFDQAIKDFNRCVELDPGNPEAFFQLGVVLGNQGHLEEAILQYSKAIIVMPSHAKAYAARSMLQSLSGRLAGAIDDINRAIDIDPEFPLFYVIRGQFLDSGGDCRGAMADYEKAMAADPVHFNTRGELAWVLATCPDQEYRNGVKALKMAHEAFASEDSHESLKILAAAYAETGDFEKAAAFQEKALAKLKEMKPQHPLDEITLKKDEKTYNDLLESYRRHHPWRHRP